jgi:MoxR-like ATPase
VEILQRKQVQGENIDVDSVVTSDEVRSATHAVQRVHVERSVMEYMAEIVQETRRDPRVLLGASARALVTLLYASKAHAALQGRSYVTPDDVKRITPFSLNHRLILKPEVVAEGMGRGQIWSYDLVAQVVTDALTRVRVPP